MRFASRVEGVLALPLPRATGVHIISMPIIMGDIGSVPSLAKDVRINRQWRLLVSRLFDIFDWAHSYRIGFLTIDELFVPQGVPYGAPGLRVASNVPEGPAYATLSNVLGQAWDQEFEGEIGLDGDCEHLRPQCSERNRVAFRPNVIYGLSPLTVYEHLPRLSGLDCQMVKLSDYSTAPWPENGTENPLGVLPPGPVNSRKELICVV